MPSSARPQPATPSSNKPVWPTSPKGFVSSPFGVQRPGHTHAGIDIAVGVGSAIYSILDGKVRWDDSNLGGYGWQIVVDHGDGRSSRYAHLSQRLKNGQEVKRGELIGRSGGARGAQGAGNSQGPHLHFEIIKGGTPVDPMPYIDGGQVLDGSPNSSPDSGGDSGASANTSSEFETLAKATAFTTFLELPGVLNSQESIALRGQRSLMNDKPLFPFVEQVCKASLRSFQSMPNGDFFAFFPDYFGTLNWRTAYWEISDLEIINGTIQLSDDALATHVFIVGDITTFGTPGIDFADKIQSGGVINIFNAFMTGFLNINFTPTAGEKPPKKDTTEPAKKEVDPAYPTLDNKAEALAFLERYGARPYYDEAPMVRSPYYETFLAYQTFMLMWSKQFLTSFEFTYMPELFPGGIVAFPEHGIQCFVDEVVHECNYESGFVTRANLSAPAAYRNPTNKELSDPARAYVHAGMIQPKMAKSPAKKDDKPSSKTKGNKHPTPKTKPNPTPRG